MHPTRIYLDQRDWISLSRAHHGHPLGARYQPVLHRLEQEVESGRVELPLSSIHFLETAQDPDVERRGRLAAVMTVLSRCRTMAPLSTVMRPKLRRQIARALAYVLPAKDIEIFGIGVHHAFGQPAGDPVLLLPAAFREILASPPGWLTASEQAKAAETMKTIRGRRETQAQGIERWRNAAKQVSRPVRNRSYAAEVWVDNLDLVNELAKIGTPSSVMTALGRERLTKIVQSVPEIDVKMALVAERNEHWDRAVDVNDDRDIDAVALAVPNCDIVVTERFWCELVERHRLAIRYDTKMIDDLTRLPELLDLQIKRAT